MHLLAFWFTACLCVVAAQNGDDFNVTSRDPRIVYLGDWTDQDNGGHKFAGGVGSSFSFTFQGSAIYWHATADPNGGVAEAVVYDGQTSYTNPIKRAYVDASSGTSKGQQPTPTILFSATGLSGSSQSTLNVSYMGTGALGGGYVEIYTLEYIDSIDSTSPATSPANSPSSDSATSTPPSSPATSSPSSPSSSATSAPSSPSSAANSPPNSSANDPPSSSANDSPSSSANSPASTPANSASGSQAYSAASPQATSPANSPATSTDASPATVPTTGSDNSSNAGRPVDKAAIAGGVVGGIIGAIVIAIIIAFAWRRRRKHLRKTGTTLMPYQLESPLSPVGMMKSSPTASSPTQPLIVREWDRERRLSSLPTPSESWRSTGTSENMPSPHGPLADSWPLPGWDWQNRSVVPPPPPYAA